MAKIDPANEPRIPPKIIHLANDRSRLPFLKWVIRATMETGRNTTKFIPWACCWGMLLNNTNEGMRIVPPPIPIPLIIPDISPIKAKIISKSSLQQYK